MTRKEVYRVIDSEREYQDSLWPQDGRKGSPNPLTVGEFLLLIENYTSQARTVWSHEKKPTRATLNTIRKIAGIVVNCMEQHGADPRT